VGYCTKIRRLAAPIGQAHGSIKCQIRPLDEQGPEKQDAHIGACDDVKRRDTLEHFQRVGNERLSLCTKLLFDARMSSFLDQQ
jgi:hypothetical protein